MNTNLMFRSNPVRVRDETSFKALLESLGVEHVWIDPDGRVMFASDEGVPSWRDIGPNDDAEEINFVKEVATHLCHGEVCVLVQVGFEGLRWLYGGAVAFDNSGREVTVSTQDVYERALAEFGIKPDLAEY